MNIVTNIIEWQSLRSTLQGKRVGFIPTMGCLHAGHLSLCERSKAENEITVVSIFVNPAQFNEASDFHKYPKNLDQDQAILKTMNIDYLFMPSAEAMYPDHYKLQLSEHELALELEGQYRPGHFTGMLTVVLKLLNLVQASKAYFGEKDYQQYLLVKKMSEALFLNTEIVACPTVREVDGLALSSRNSRLNAGQRKKATVFAQLLKENKTLESIEQKLQAEGFKVDYVAERWGRRLAAVWIDDIRLIDNESLDPIVVDLEHK